MPDWLTSTLTAYPAILWGIIGLGIPWALVALPRRDWQDRAMIACLSLAFGPALLTGWMFVLGTLGQNHDPDAGETLNPMQTNLTEHMGGTALLRTDLILAGTVAIALAGIALAWWKYRHRPAPEKRTSRPLAGDERLLIFFIVLAVIARWIITSWLGFGAWDPLWVYGYQGRIYTLTGYIPADIGYYPQYLPLQYAYTQIVSTGGIDDHAARAVLPFLQVGSILAVYLLGSRLFNRRTGIIAAALWALYPHFGYWTRVGDLEIPVTFAFTGAAVFFLLGWTMPSENRNLRRHYAVIAGLFLGVAMWTKPTAGAFIWGVLLLLAIEFLRARDWQAWLPRFEVALFTGLASLPLGAVWYIRNMLIGHAAINFPPTIWLTRAMRSGAEFGWPLLALGVLLAYLYFGPVSFRPGRRGGAVGLALLLAGVLPTIIEPGRIGPLEWIAFAAGVVVLASTLGDYLLVYHSSIADETWAKLGKVGWALLLALPYFVTWFYSYSYHYRLSFTIVPLMLLPTAVILANWLTAARIHRWNLTRRIAYTGLLVALSLPGVAISIFDEGLGWDWLWTIPPPGDYSQSAQLGVVDTIRAYIDAHDDPPVVAAPAIQTLPFYFPTIEVRTVETPRRIDALRDVTHFINSRETLEAYELTGDVAPFQNQWLASLNRENVVTRVAHYQDPGFFYDVYELHTEDRFIQPEVGTLANDAVIFGDFARYVGHTVSGDTFGPEGITLEIIWQAVDTTPEDYTIYVHLIKGDAIDDPWAIWDGPVVPTALGYYSTRFWEAGEYIIDRRALFLQDSQTPSGGDYHIRIGFYHPETGQRVPVLVDGEPAGDGYTLETDFSH